MVPYLPCIALSSLVVFGTFNVAAAADSERPATVEIFAAGSLRGVVGDLAAMASSDMHLEVKATFGGSGTLRERIEQGGHPDLLLSADLGSPRKLELAGHTVVPAVAFARNRMCVVSRRDSGFTAANLIEKLLLPTLRVKTSTPIADPSGDYAWAIFDRIDQLRPGAGDRLKDKARSQMNVVATPTDPNQSATAALFAAHQIDVAITYCSASVALERELPQLMSVVVAAPLDPHPVYGIAVLSDKPAALRLALLLLSEKGQALVEKNGLLPLLDAVPTPH
jgi:molybdate transport system substrate-binding protein